MPFSECPNFTIACCHARTTPVVLVSCYNLQSTYLGLHYIFHLRKCKAKESVPLSICTWFLKFSSLKYRVWWTGFFPKFELDFSVCKIQVWNIKLAKSRESKRSDENSEIFTLNAKISHPFCKIRQNNNWNICDFISWTK